MDFGLGSARTRENPDQWEHTCERTASEVQRKQSELFRAMARQWVGLLLLASIVGSACATVFFEEKFGERLISSFSASLLA